MDNLSSHKGPAIRMMIKTAGAHLLYLPPYSPDFSPIENTCSKPKTHLRTMATRTVPTLWDAIANLIDTIYPLEAANIFRNAGYEPVLSESALALDPNKWTPVTG